MNAFAAKVPENAEAFSSPSVQRATPSFGQAASWADSQLYCGFYVIDAPDLGLKGLRYSIAGLAVSAAKAIIALQGIAARRNQLVPRERMTIDVASIKFPVDQETIKADSVIALRKLPKGLSALEMCDGEPGAILNQSLASLLKEQESIEDINSILT